MRLSASPPSGASSPPGARPTRTAPRLPPGVRRLRLPPTRPLADATRAARARRAGRHGPRPAPQGTARRTSPWRTNSLPCPTASRRYSVAGVATMLRIRSPGRASLARTGLSRPPGTPPRQPAGGYCLRCHCQAVAPETRPSPAHLPFSFFLSLSCGAELAFPPLSCVAAPRPRSARRLPGRRPA